MVVFDRPRRPSAARKAAVGAYTGGCRETALGVDDRATVATNGSRAAYAPVRQQRSRLKIGSRQALPRSVQLPLLYQSACASTRTRRPSPCRATVAGAFDEGGSRGSPTVLLGPREKIERMFLLFDADEDGRLNYEELCHLLSAVAEQEWRDDHRYGEWCSLLGADPDLGLNLSDFSKLLSLEKRFLDDAFRGVGLESVGPRPITNPAALRGELLRRALSGGLSGAASMLTRCWRADLVRVVACELTTCCLFQAGVCEARIPPAPPATWESGGPDGALASLLRAADTFVEAAANAADDWHDSFQDCLRRGSFDRHVKEWAELNAKWGAKIAAFQAKCRSAEGLQQAVSEGGGASASAELIWHYVQAVTTLAVATDMACGEDISAPPKSLQDLYLAAARFQTYGLPGLVDKIVAKRAGGAAAMAGAAAAYDKRPSRGCTPTLRAASAMGSDASSNPSQRTMPSAMPLPAVKVGTSATAALVAAASPRPAQLVDRAPISSGPRQLWYKELPVLHVEEACDTSPKQEPQKDVDHDAALRLELAALVESHEREGAHEHYTILRRELEDCDQPLLEDEKPCDSELLAVEPPVAANPSSNRPQTSAGSARSRQGLRGGPAGSKSRPISRASCRSGATSNNSYEMDDFERLSEADDNGGVLNQCDQQVHVQQAKECLSPGSDAGKTVRLETHEGEEDVEEPAKKEFQTVEENQQQQKEQLQMVVQQEQGQQEPQRQQELRKEQESEQEKEETELEHEQELVPEPESEHEQAKGLGLGQEQEQEQVHEWEHEQRKDQEQEHVQEPAKASEQVKGLAQARELEQHNEQDQDQEREREHAAGQEQEHEQAQAQAQEQKQEKEQQQEQQQDREQEHAQEQEQEQAAGQEHVKEKEQEREHAQEQEQDYEQEQEQKHEREQVQERQLEQEQEHEREHEGQQVHQTEQEQDQEQGRQSDEVHTENNEHENPEFEAEILEERAQRAEDQQLAVEDHEERSASQEDKNEETEEENQVDRDLRAADQQLANEENQVATICFAARRAFYSARAVYKKCSCEEATAMQDHEERSATQEDKNRESKEENQVDGDPQEADQQFANEEIQVATICLAARRAFYSARAVYKKCSCEEAIAMQEHGENQEDKNLEGEQEKQVKRDQQASNQQLANEDYEEHSANYGNRKQEVEGENQEERDQQAADEQLAIEDYEEHSAIYENQEENQEERDQQAAGEQLAIEEHRVEPQRIDLMERLVQEQERSAVAKTLGEEGVESISLAAETPSPPAESSIHTFGFQIESCRESHGVSRSSSCYLESRAESAGASESSKLLDMESDDGACQPSPSNDELFAGGGGLDNNEESFHCTTN